MSKLHLIISTFVQWNPWRHKSNIVRSTQISWNIITDTGKCSAYSTYPPYNHIISASVCYWNVTNRYKGSNFCYATRQAEMNDRAVKLLAKSCSWTTVVGILLVHQEYQYIIDWNVLMPLCQSLYKSIKARWYAASFKLELYRHFVTVQ